MMMAAQVVVRTGDAAAVVVEVLVAACCPAVEWREKTRSGSWRRPAIPETAEPRRQTCETVGRIRQVVKLRIVRDLGAPRNKKDGGGEGSYNYGISKARFSKGAPPPHPRARCTQNPLPHAGTLCTSRLVKSVLTTNTSPT